MDFQDFFYRICRASDIKTQKQLAELLNVGAASITLAKSRGVPKGWPYQVATILGLNPNWIKTGQGPIYQSGREDSFLVPKVSAKACAGAGSLEIQDNIVDEIPFSLQWISQKGSPRHMVLMDIVGESMSPELEEGDAILVDQSQQSIINRNLYVVGLDDTIQVKRVQTSTGLVVLLSSNRNFMPITLQGDELDNLRVIGRVLWSSREYC
ncbi:LexA family transcriptional regulator [Desulfonatronovibrio magnus]|uniref:LexA family transcriptional regulator n=1 Tax=Desulfonatronovibrio magnus TaxID=698827 RepID=UPI0005EAD91F|nr:S24 family peptidase [Desulfonatronovibrio magnus]